MYRLDRMRRDYNKFTAAEGYAIGFHIGEDVYCAMIEDIPRRYTTIQKESKSNGGGYGLYINVKNNKKKNELLKHSVKVGTLADLEGQYNKGVMFEQLVYNLFGEYDPNYVAKDHTPFYVDGDVVINGKRIQVKYEHARICYDRTLKNLKKGA